jgi:hypothetical protein
MRRTSAATFGAGSMFQDVRKSIVPNPSKRIKKSLPTLCLCKAIRITSRRGRWTGYEIKGMAWCSFEYKLMTVRCARLYLGQVKVMYHGRQHRLVERAAERVQYCEFKCFTV